MINQATAPEDDRRARRRAEILAAATEVFLDAGFAGASIDDVLTRVGGSKRTIYSYFGSKEALFSAIVTELSASALAPLSNGEVQRHDLATTLHHMGLRYLNVIMSPQALRLYRTVVAEAQRFPELAKAFFEAGPGRASSRLKTVLEQMQEPWGISVPDLGRASEQFLGMIRDELHLQVVLGLRDPPSAEEAEATVRQATSTFLNGCRKAF